VKRNTLLYERALYNDLVSHTIKKCQHLRHSSFYLLLCPEGTATGPVPEDTATGPVPCNSSILIRTLTKPSCALLIFAVTC